MSEPFDFGLLCFLEVSFFKYLDGLFSGGCDDKSKIPRTENAQFGYDRLLFTPIESELPPSFVCFD